MSITPEKVMLDGTREDGFHRLNRWELVMASKSVHSRSQTTPKANGGERTMEKCRDEECQAKGVNQNLLNLREGGSWQSRKSK